MGSFTHEEIARANYRGAGGCGCDLDRVAYEAEQPSRLGWLERVGSLGQQRRGLPRRVAGDLRPVERLQRDQWHASDIYQIWREPSVQAFLEKPLAKVPKNTGAHETLQKITRLDPKNIFLALISLENNEPKIIAGFHFEGNQAEVEDLLLALETDILGPLHHTRKVSSWLDVLTDTEVS